MIAGRGYYDAMPARRFTLPLIILSSALAACRGYRSYTPAPVDTSAHAATYEARRLDDSKLLAFLTAHGAAADGGATPSALGLAALYFRSDVSESRALVTAARAGEITAGTRPYPSASATLERSASSGNSSPWTLSLATGITFETGGKREARLARSRAFTLATQLRLQSTAWQLAQEARVAAVSSVAAEGDLADAAAEVGTLRVLLDLLRARYAEGRISLADLAQAETDVQIATVAEAQARRARTDARSALARALAVPLPAIERLPIREEPRSGCEPAESPRTDSVIATFDTTALRQRYDVGAALADYAVAEADLRLQLAQQYPDLVIGPGIAWDQGVGRWLLSLGSNAIPLNRNRGPIAEAEARRVARAAHFAFVQDSVLAQVDSAVAACRDVHAEIAAADSLVAATRERLRLAQAAYARGETGKTEVAFARLAVVRVTRVQRQALQRRQRVGAVLEAAVGRWSSVPAIRWPEVLEELVPPPPDNLRERRE